MVSRYDRPAAVNRPRSATPRKSRALEGESFQTSVVYWTGVFEEKFNAVFVQRMGSGKTIIPRWRTLSVLSEKSGLTVNELAHHTRIERSALSHLLLQMEKEDLVVRQQAATDKRNVHVHMTERGHEAFLTMLPVRREILKQAARDIPPAQMEALRSTVQALVAGLDALAGRASLNGRPAAGARSELEARRDGR